MIPEQEDVKLDFEVKEEDMPKADADLSHTLDSIERMLSLSPNKEVLKNLLDVVVSNEGVSENPDQASRIDQLKVKIVAKLGGEISESASCGATSSCSIATVAEPLTSGKKKKVKPIRRKIVGIDALSFMECVNDDIPSVVRIRDVVFKNSLVGKHPVLMANECVVPVYGKEKINNLVKKYYLDGEDFEICESVISPVDYLIMRGEIICESDDLKFDDKKAQQEKDDPQIDANLRNQVGRQTIATVEKNKSGDNSGKTSDDIKTNQELVGVDDSDPTQKKYVIKDPQTGKISVKKQSEVAIQNEAVKYYKKPLLEVNRKPREMRMVKSWKRRAEIGPLPSIENFTDYNNYFNGEWTFNMYWHDTANRKTEVMKHAMRILKEWLRLNEDDLEEALRCLKIERSLSRDLSSGDLIEGEGWDITIRSDNSYSYEYDESYNPLNESDLEETKASRFNQHLDNREQSFATISAERRNDNVHKGFGVKSFSDYKNKQERHQDKNYQRYAAFNNRRTRKLYDLLEKMGLTGYIRSKGGYRELTMTDNDVEEENSVFIPNITLEQAIALGKVFNQDSVMFKEKGSDEIHEYATNKSYAEGNNIKIGDKTGTTFICCQGRYNSANDKTYYTKPKQTAYKFSFNSEKKN